MADKSQGDPHPLVNFILRANRDVPLFPKSHADYRAKRGVLDAIASVCVSKAQGQAVATSLTLPNENEILICVAQNDHDLVSDETVSFLKKLWVLLQELSAYDKKYRAAKNGIPSEGELPQLMYIGEIRESLKDIKILCYKQGIRKLRQRVQKYWEDFSRLCELWQRDPRRPECLRVEFQQIWDNLRLVNDLLTSSEPDCLQLSQLIESSRNCFDKLSHGRHLQICMKIYTQEIVPTKESFTLSHYLMKVFSLDHSILKLCGFARSRRMHVFEQRELIIQWIPSELGKPEIPLTKGDWTMYMLQVFEVAGIEDRTLSKSTVEEEVRLALETQVKNPVPVHSECILLAHHHRQLNFAGPETRGKTVIPPNRYIGCSKEACYACVQYVNAYNTPDINKYSTSFQIRGPGLKLCDGWSVPFLHDRDADSCVREELYRLLCKDYADDLLALKRVEKSSIHADHPILTVGECPCEDMITPSLANGSGPGSSTDKLPGYDDNMISSDPPGPGAVEGRGFLRAHSGDTAHQRGNTKPLDKTFKDTGEK